MSTITTRRQTLALASRYAREEVDARLRDAVSDDRAAEERAEGVDTGATRDEVLRAYTDRGQLGPSEGWAGAGAFGLIPERVPERWQPLFLRTLDRVARRYAETLVG